MTDRKTYAREWRVKNRDKIRAYQREWYAANPGRRKELAKAYQKKHRQRLNAYAVSARKALRERMLSIYGKICACCGEAEQRFLTLDHVNGDGRKHRLELRGSNDKLLRVICKTGVALPAYQVLCFNCNCGRQANGGICPHKNNVLDTKPQLALQL